MNWQLPRRLLLLVASASLVVGIAACGNDDDNGANGNGDPTTAPATEPANGNGNGGDNGNGNGEAVTEITISMQDNFFEPAEITIPVGQSVSITAKNEGVAVHNMVIRDTDFGSDMMVTAGDESTFEVQFSEAGTYTYECSYHLPDMVGTITVE